ncbi:SIS domain-containing protein [Auraticoccus monumenti]|uniref:Phospho-glucose isomerase C-terminal SIS domain-containing protein n=1 Tax=Auraticoccus monumenti TaxID=675864 RepID=A0A1G6Z6B4_9ACTN|nr:SIS domain-containing protein [Auraticoccus monumenti]SDD97507.1 phospho-glucose isomerase C-terminal SIS domain-containing protein [Auraticoccus monumenti]
MVAFEDYRLEDRAVLEAADPLLRRLAGAGARIRVEAEAAREPTSLLDEAIRPRAVIAVGSEARLVRSLLEPVCPVPMMAWPGPALPGWVGPLDLVVVLAAHGGEQSLVHAASEAVRRGCQLLVAAPESSPVAESSMSRSTTLLTTRTSDPLAAVAVTAAALHALGLGPVLDLESVAGALDRVAEECSPWVDLSSNPAKDLALSMADTEPLVWGGSVLAARAARRVAEALRAASGRPALATDAEALMPVITAAEPRDPFADPFDAPITDRRPCLLLLEDGHTNELLAVARRQLEGAAEMADVRTCKVLQDEGSELLRYAVLLQKGLYAAAYLAIGLNRLQDPPSDW